MEKWTLTSSLILLCLLATLVPLASSASDIIVWLESATVEDGETAMVSITIENVSNLGYARVNLTFNELVVDVTAVLDSDFDSPPDNYTRGPGWVLLEGGQFEKGLEGTVRLCNLTLHAIGERGDMCMLNLTDVALDDMQMNPIKSDKVINSRFAILLTPTPTATPPTPTATPTTPIPTPTTPTATLPTPTATPSSDWTILIIIALIGAVATILAALINNLASRKRK